MRILLLTLLTFLTFLETRATDYYVSPSGNDNNSGTQASPWRTATKAVSVAKSGDKIYLEAGGEYYGGIAPASGVSFNSYGSGAKPVITGLTQITNWTSRGSGVYESVVSGAQSTLNMVVMNGNFQAVGRYPKVTAANKGYLNVSSHSGNSSVNGSLSGAPSAVGGEVVIRKNHWILERGTITSQSGSSVSYSGGGSYSPTDGFGFFLQNHVNLLTATGEWAFESSSKKVQMYFGGSGPGSNDVRVATVSNLVTLSSKSGISFTNISFQGANNHLFSVSGSSSITLTDCELEFAGVDGFNTNASTSGITLLRTNFTWSNNNHIRSNNATDWNIQDCVFTNNGMTAGMGGNGDGTYYAISDLANNSLIQYCSIINSGYVGINFNGSAASGNNIRVLNNLVDGFCLVKDDGAGIYTGYVGGIVSHSTCRIENNIIKNGLGANDGAGNGTQWFQVHGIYMDDYSNNVVINGNSITNCGGSGIYLHLSNNITLTNNTTYANKNEELLISATENSTGAIRNITMNGNVFFNMTKDNSQLYWVALIRSLGDDIGQWGTWNNNYFCRPLNSEKQSFFVRHGSNDDIGDLPMWKSISGKDGNSKGTPVTVTDPNKVRFEYNASKSSKTVSLGANYLDAKGANYAGSITLAPYTSAVLIQTSGTVNQQPQANAGPDQSINLPTSTVTLNGSGSDPDGAIASYNWTKVSGPSQGSITTPNGSQTTVTNLVSGTYQFQLQVTDNSGATATDVITVNVITVAVNKPPVANAGSNLNITLPTVTVSLSGSGTDPDGTIASYAWTKISGPSLFNILTPTNALTSVISLVQGTYQFQLQVTDNAGAVGKDTVVVSVNAAPPPNIVPVSNAGNDVVITLPTNTATLSGSGTDQDGTIASYAWTKIAGPSQFNIASPSSAQTNLTNLAQGTYQFQLTVTDDDGGTDVDIVIVTVNPAPAPPQNVAPTANAGNNANITLPANTVTLSGSGTDTDGTIASYAWTKISGPSQFTFVNASSAQTAVNNLVEGTYQFQLTVTDDDGATATDVVVITVNPAPVNQIPTANAGSNKSITLPTNSVSLTGSGTDADGTITAYSWTKVSGPTQNNIVSPTSATTTIDNLVQGTYQFQLKVTDNNGATGTDVVTVTVNAQPVNQAPTANAGSNKTITLPTNSVSLSGSGNDADGTIASYSWTKIAGPTQFNIVSGTAAQTTVNNLVQGTYQFQLTVTDNSGATGTDVVVVTVNAAANQAPTANAGNNQTITSPASSVTLNGSGTDADGTIATYAWTKIAGPTQFNIVTAGAAQTTVNNLVQGTYQFQLIVTDDDGATATDVVIITVNAPAPNQAPNANAGSNRTITLPANSVTLNGIGSDADGTIATYAWTWVSGPSQFNIQSSSSASTVINNLVQGVYTFQLTVTDNLGATDADNIRVTVNAAPVNRKPNANAGSNKNITLPTNSVTLVGSGSDSDGTITSFSWAKISGPSQFNIAAASAATTSIDNLAEGTYEFQLSVTDNAGASDADIVTVTVNAAAVPNQAPVVEAGNNIAITLPTSDAVLSGSATDADGTIASYSWTKISGPAQFNIVSASNAQTTVNNLVEGVYQFQLQATDDDGGTGTDIVVVTVNPKPANQLPEAIAGNSISITLPNSTASLNGSGTDADGTITGYAWTKISGPAQFTITDPASAQTTVTGLEEGVYEFELEVTDNDGGTATDIVTVTVNGAPNQAPNADAGSNATITLPTSTVTFSGSGTDADGTIASYEWTKVTGPSQFTIANPNSPSTAVNNLVEGVYYFMLKVTDNGGRSGYDFIKVTVNPAPPNVAPVANAGNNVTITLPANSVSLVGTGTDTDGSITNYNWTKIAGPGQYTIVSPTTGNTAVNNLVQGTYQFQLTVTDNNGATGTDVVTVTVNDAPPPANILPVADAGSNVSITLPVSTVTLSGSGIDVDGTIASYAWTKLTGPASSTIVTPGAAQTTINNLAQGVYEFQLQVTDNSGGTGTDVVTVTVNSAPVNQAPTVSVGNNVTISLPTNTVSLTGTASDADGTIATYSWTKVSGPSQYTITSAGTAQTDVTGLLAGVYQFQLQVTDNQGASASDVVTVTVNAPPPNQAPTVNAGQNVTMTLPVNSVTLNGVATDADGTIQAYNWTQIAGPSQFTITSPAAASTSITGLVEGVYYFQLVATDDDGTFGWDIVKVTVNAAPVNQLPVANAGNNVAITLPVNTVTLHGSATDPDGTIVSYSWAKIAGPQQYTIANPNSATTAINNLAQGTYQFQLQVTDDDGGISTSIVTVTVNGTQLFNQLPVADAGNDIVITLPQNSVSLLGTGTDADGTITAFAWSKVAGPAEGTIQTPNTASTAVNNLVEGVYQFQLQVTDNSGGTGRNVVIVTVNALPPAPNKAPLANAGEDTIVILPNNSVTLQGTGTDVDGTITGYYWNMVDGPAAYEITDRESPITTVSGLTEGTYTFELEVTDNNRSTGKDRVTVIVKDLATAKLSLYPNPVRDVANLQIESKIESSPTAITVYDLNGRVLLRDEFQRTQRIVTKQLDMSRYPNGTYLIKVTSDSDTPMTIKMLKQ